MNTCRFNPSGPLRGALRAPADKSISHRAAIIGAICDEPVTIRGYLDSADTNSTLSALRSVGVAAQRLGDDVVVRGVGLRGALEALDVVDVGNSGTLIRLLPGWLAGQPSGSWVLDGDESIRRRPMARIVEPLRLMGGDIEMHDDGTPPLIVNATPLFAIDYTLPVASAQVKSCILLASLTVSGESRLREPVATRDHTERMLYAAGVPIRREGNEIVVGGLVDELELGTIDVPGDMSSAAFFIAAALIVGDSRVTVENVGLNRTRTGFIDIARRMGGAITTDSADTGEPIPFREPSGAVEAVSGPLAGVVVEAGEVPLAIDELPLVALLGCFAEGETIVRGAEELRHKESDRISTVVEGLRGLGADIEATADGFAVRGRGSLRGGRIDSHGDHRLAMLGAIAGLASKEGVEVVDMGAAAVSYPGFERDLAALLPGGDATGGIRL